MTHPKLSRWLKRGAFTVVAVAAIVMLSAEQSQAQCSGGRGFSGGSFGRGISVGVGNGFNRGFSNYGRGFSNFGGFNNFSSGARYIPRSSFYRGGGFYGGRSSFGRSFSRFRY